MLEVSFRPVYVFLVMPEQLSVTALIQVLSLLLID